MAARKPPNVSFNSWVDQQVREAEDRGAFDELEGRGKPIPDIDRPQSELEWIAKLLRRENVDPALLLPPSLALKKEMQDLRARLAGEANEDRVRELVLDLNQRIREAHRRPQEGPPLTVMSVDVEATMARWRNDRNEVEAAAARARAEREQVAAGRATAAVPARRRWWPRRSAAH